MILDDCYPRLFGLDAEHDLELDSERRTERDGATRETRWFIERDATTRIVARYRTWTTRSARAPFRQQLGWERYSPRGELEVREVRYANGKRPATDVGGWLN